jgi:hypothetical protein
MNLTPRQHFQEDKTSVKFHQDLVVLTRFRDACHAALLEQVMNTPMTYNPVEAAAYYNQIMGARDFLFHLLSIAEPKKPVAAPPSGNLNHRT